MDFSKQFKSLIAVLLSAPALLIASAASAEIEVTVPAGRVAILKDDMTWRFKAPPDRVAFERWSDARCRPSGAATFRLNTPETAVKRLQTRFRPTLGGSAPKARLYNGVGMLLLDGPLAKDECRSGWCVGSLDVELTLGAGEYFLLTVPPTFCATIETGDQAVLRVLAPAIEAHPPATPRAKPDLAVSGLWLADGVARRISLEQAGDYVEGVLERPEGRFQGVVGDGGLTGIWTLTGAGVRCAEPRMAAVSWGEISATPSPDGDTLTGSWNMCGEHPGKPFRAVRAGTQPAPHAAASAGGDRGGCRRRAASPKTAR